MYSHTFYADHSCCGFVVATFEQLIFQSKTVTLCSWLTFSQQNTARTVASQRRIQNPVRHLKLSVFGKFRKPLHLKCLRGFPLRFCFLILLYTFFGNITQVSEAPVGGASWKKLFLEISQISQENFIKMSHQHRCFLVKFVKFLKAPVLKNIYERLLLKCEYLFIPS